MQTCFSQIQVGQLLRNEAVNSWTRRVLDGVVSRHSHVIVWDVEGLHALNHRFGMSKVDDMLQFAHLRISDVVQWAGDEFVVLADERDVLGLVNKIHDGYSTFGIRIHLVVEEVADNDFNSAIKKALDKIMLIKQKRDNSFLNKIKRTINIWFPGYGMR